MSILSEQIHFPERVNCASLELVQMINRALSPSVCAFQTAAVEAHYLRLLVRVVVPCNGGL